jgi:hypothetical protein
MKRLLSIESKQFATGIAPSAHTETGGLFFKADGINPFYDAGGTASTQNGLLQAGSSPTDFSALGTIADAVIAGDIGIASSTPYLLMIGNGGHFYLKQVGSGDVIDRASTNVIANPANGVVVWAPAGGTQYCYYWQKTQIGTYDITGNNHPATPDTHWVDNAYTGLTSTSNHPVHKFQGNIYYGNSITVGALLDNGSGGVTHSTNVLDFPIPLKVTALSDDGTYLVVALTENSGGYDTFSRNKIVFWDLYSPQWTREWDIRDPFIWALKKIDNTVYAFGQYGIYEVSFGGVKKILSRLIGFGTMSDVANGYGANRATVYNGQALMFGTDTTIDTFGKLSPDLPNAYLKPFKIPSAVGTPTFISSDLDTGRVYVATDGNKLYGYDFNATTRDTGVSAQTVYVPLGAKAKVEEIRVVFGEPLVSGDSVSFQWKSDEDTTAGTAKVLSFADDGAIRKGKVSTGDFTADEQLSLIVNFVAGSPKIKKIEVWGDFIPEI